MVGLSLPWLTGSHLFKHQVNMDWHSQLSLSPCTLTLFLIQQSWVMIVGFIDKCFVCKRTKLMTKMHHKWSHSSWVTDTSKSTTQCKMLLFCTKRVTQFWTSPCMRIWRRRRLVVSRIEGKTSKLLDFLHVLNQYIVWCRDVLNFTLMAHVKTI